jgi:hypothetical protein
MISDIDQLVSLKVDTDIVTHAHKKSVEMGELKNSITKGEGNLVGFIGEGLVHKYLLDNEETVRWISDLRPMDELTSKSIDS